MVKQRCSGCFCEKAFCGRTGGFAACPSDKSYRVLNMTCGGCCGTALHRKLANLVGKVGKRGKIDKNRIVVQLASSITKDNYHRPPCPHFDYIRQLIEKLGLDACEDTSISRKSDQRRGQGTHKS